MRNFNKQPRGGVRVDVELKKRLRNRSLPLTNAQRYNLKQMGIKVSKNTTEKEAASMAKRVCGPETNYKINPEASLLFRKRKTAKPKSMSPRQARIEVLLHRIAMPHEVIDKEGNVTKHSGSNRALKQLASL